MKDHLPRHLLEKLVADDPHAPVHPALWVHVASCDRCSTRKRALEAVRARYLVEYPAADFALSVIARAAQPEPAPRRTPNAVRILAIAAGLSIAPAIALFWFARTPEPPALRWQGGVAFEVFAKRVGTTRVLDDGAQLTQADQLSFAYALDRPRFLLLLGIDDRGTLTRYFPTKAAQPTALAASARTQLPLGGELSVRRGQERLFALFSDAALDEDEARGALARALTAARGRGAGIADLNRVDLPGQQLSVWFRKP